jgi:hypothetical protein
MEQADSAMAFLMEISGKIFFVLSIFMCFCIHPTLFENPEMHGFILTDDGYSFHSNSIRYITYFFKNIYGCTFSLFAVENPVKEMCLQDYIPLCKRLKILLTTKFF